MRHHIGRPVALAFVLLLCLGAPICLSLLALSPANVRVAHESLTIPIFGQLLGNSFLFSLGTALFAVALGTPIALTVFRLHIPGVRFLRIILVATCTLPLYVYAAAWLGGMGINGANSSDRLGSMLHGIFISGMAKTPIAAILLGLALWGLDPALEELAWLEARRVTVLVRVVLRHLLRGVPLAIAILMGLSLGEIAITDMLNIRTLAEEAYAQYQLTLDPGAASLVGLSVFLPILIPWMWLTGSLARRDLTTGEAQYRNTSGVFVGLPIFVQIGAITTVCGILAIVLGIPLYVLVKLTESFGVLLTGFAHTGVEAGFSLLVGCAASLIAVLFALPVVLACRHTWWASSVAAIALAALFVPGSTVGIGLVHAFNHPGPLRLVYDSPLILVVGQTLRSFPLVLLVLLTFVRSSPRLYDDLGAIDGAGHWRKLVHIHMPILRRPLLLSWALAFIWCLSELDTSMIVCPPGPTTLPIRIFTMMHYGIYGDVASACFLLIGVIWLAALLVMIVDRKLRVLHAD